MVGLLVLLCFCIIFLDSLLLSLHCFLIYLYCLSHCFFLENTLFSGRSSEHLRQFSFYIYGRAIHIHFAVDSLLINSLMTGILSGIGCGLVFRFGGSTGGTDIIYQAIEKYFHIKIGKSLFLITFGILVVSLLYLDLTHFLYTLLSCSILSYTLNKVKYLEIGILFCPNWKQNRLQKHLNHLILLNSQSTDSYFSLLYLIYRNIIM